MHIMKAVQLIVLLCFITGSAQKTLQLKEGQISPKATLQEVDWLVGHWKGEAFGGIVEEIWSPPAGESMMFVFRLIDDGKVSFYEVGHIKQVDGTLLMQLKHFDENLKGWEEKAETVDFKLVKLKEDKVFFEGATFENIGETQMNIYVLIENDGKKEEVIFEYKRI